MIRKTTLTLLLLIAVTSSIYAQHKISGTLSDKTTGSAVAFATVQLKNAKSTLTNENGEFEISCPSLPAIVLISHLNYQSISIQVSTTDQPLKIKLVPQVVTLKDVTVGNPAIAIMQEASNKAYQIKNQSFYGRAFLRQIAYEGEEPTYMNEIFFDAEWKPFSMVKWHPTQARHLQGANKLSYDNMSFITFISSGYLSNNEFTKPMARRVDSLYNFKLVASYQQNGQEIVKINCIPKSGSKPKKLQFHGYYYVNTVTNDVLKIEGDIKGLKLSGWGPLTFKNKMATFSAQYKLNAEGFNVLDYVIFNTSNLFKIAGIKAKTTDVYSTLCMIDEQAGDKSELKSINIQINDSDLARKLSYTDEFWKNNQVIKRTEKEQTAIEILEKIPQVRK